jgi:peptidoglycan-associated lipoprotein
MAFTVALILAVALAKCSSRETRMEPVITPTADLKEVKRYSPTPSSPYKELKTIYFDYDKSNLRSDAKETLKANAKWLKEHPLAHVQIEGHCDERGTRQYNLNLGEKRANHTREYLIALGIDGSRMTSISYGADLATDSTEYPIKRKANFVIIFTEDEPQKAE